MLQIVIADDNLEHAKKNLAIINQHLTGKNEILLLQSGEKLLAKDNEYKPDIAFLDIELNGENGIALAEKLCKRYPMCQVIFVTNYLSYAVDVYRTEHVYFVTKDRIEETLHFALDKAIRRIEMLKPATLFLCNKNEDIILQQNDIFYLERIKRKTLIKSSEEETETPINLEQLQEQLSPKYFCRCHRSYIVNLSHVAKVRYNGFILESKEWVPIGRHFNQEVKQALVNYLQNI